MFIHISAIDDHHKLGNTGDPTMHMMNSLLLALRMRYEVWDYLNLSGKRRTLSDRFCADCWLCGVMERVSSGWGTAVLATVAHVVSTHLGIHHSSIGIL